MLRSITRKWASCLGERAVCGSRGSGFWGLGFRAVPLRVPFKELWRSYYKGAARVLVFWRVSAALQPSLNQAKAKSRV